ncbi:MAG: hypothetical protein HYZ26_02805 [Chloroflexi bacterium]|nr:hypothetical protein [Chloroflexota bacterium]
MAHLPDSSSQFREYWAAYEWLLSLIQDPQGKRYLTARSKEERLVEMKSQIPRLQQFLDFTNNPEDEFHSIHIAGTSGKGSVTMMLASILNASGIRSGHHVSPYLQLCNEKLVFEGRPIPPWLFALLVESFRTDYSTWQSQAAGNHLKYGEAWVALTLRFFAQQRPEWVVLETGMGGRFDPTNVVASELAIITNIDYDHTESLGASLEEIAWHKAGIIKPGKAIITAEQHPATLRVIEGEARSLEAPLYRLGHEFDFEVNSEDLVLRVHTPFGEHAIPRFEPRGRHQAANASLTVTAIDLLRSHYGLMVSEDDLQNGLGSVRLEGRFETVQTDPLVILDGAHNPAKMAALASNLNASFPGRRVSMVFGMLGMKEGDAMLRLISPFVQRWFLTQPSVLGKPAMPIRQLANLLAHVDPEAKYTTHPELNDAIDAALMAINQGEVLVITGSIYLVGAARNRWVHPEQLLATWEADWPNPQ